MSEWRGIYPPESRNPRYRERTELDDVCTACGGMGEVEVHKPANWIGTNSYTVTCSACEGNGKPPQAG